MKVQSLILCDDVRQEIGNKFTLVGIYDHTIQIGVPEGVKVPWPIGIPLGFMVRGTLDKEEAQCDTIDIQFLHNDSVVAKLSANIRVTDIQKPFSIHTKLPNFPIAGAGTLSFQLTLREGTKVIGDFVPDYRIEITLKSGVEKPSRPSPSI